MISVYSAKLNVNANIEVDTRSIEKGLFIILVDEL